ncbi:MAG: Gfo/Idh/MocA family oxidoreductase, partial [Armatimonadetes bacterium]|nr:Gfo/Idh/MocA family oxidoreductase [Armatimonadota bacterium]
MAAPVRLGILSTARIGGRILAALREGAAAELVAVSSRDAASLERYVAEHQLAASVRQQPSYEALLADESVEAVYNPLPNALHAEWTIRAAEAGKHVLCEKPLARNVAECLAMIAAAERAGVVLMEAFMYRYHPATRRLRELVAEGALGELRLIRSGFCFNVDDPANIRLSAPLAGGATMDVGCYCINLARYLTAEEPVAAYAVGSFGDASGVDETICATLEFPSGAVAQFECSVKSAGRVFANVLGSRGTLEVERPWTPHPERATLRVNGQEEVIEQGGDPFGNELEAFCAAVRGRARLPIEPLDGARNMAALVAVL